MSLIETVSEKDNRKLDSVVNRLKLLHIEPTDEVLTKIYDKLLNIAGCRIVHEDRHTSVGLKGFDLALQALLITAGHREHEFLPSLDSDGQLIPDGSVEHSFKLMIGNGESNHKDVMASKAMHRGFRLGLYTIGKESPDIRYLGSRIALGQMAVVAEDVNSNRVLLGQHFDATHLPHFENGYYGSFPANAKRGYSFIVANSADTVY